MSIDQQAEKPKRRGPGKPAAQQAAPVAKLTLSIPADLARRFGVHAEMTGQSKSELFAELVRAHCRRFVVHDHGKDADQGEAGAA